MNQPTQNDFRSMLNRVRGWGGARSSPYAVAQQPITNQGGGRIQGGGAPRYDIGNMRGWINQQLPGNANITTMERARGGLNVMNIRYQLDSGALNQQAWQDPNTGTVFMGSKENQSGGFAMQRHFQSEQGDIEPFLNQKKYGAAAGGSFSEALRRPSGLSATFDQDNPNPLGSQWLSHDEYTPQQAGRIANQGFVPEGMDPFAINKATGGAYAARNAETRHLDLLPKTLEFARLGQIPPGYEGAGSLASYGAPASGRQAKQIGQQFHNQQLLSHGPGLPVASMRSPISWNAGKQGGEYNLNRVSMRLRGPHIAEGAALTRRGSFYSTHERTQTMKTSAWNQLQQKYGIQSGDVYGFGGHKFDVQSEGSRWRGNLSDDMPALNLTRGNYAGMRFGNITTQGDMTTVNFQKYGTRPALKEGGLKAQLVSAGEGVIPGDVDFQFRASQKYMGRFAQALYEGEVGSQGRGAVRKDFHSWMKGNKKFSSSFVNDVMKEFDRPEGLGHKGLGALGERAMEYTEGRWEPVTDKNVQLSGETFKMYNSNRRFQSEAKAGRPLFTNVRKNEGGAYTVDVNDYEIKGTIAHRARAEFASQQRNVSVEEMHRLSQANPQLYKNIARLDASGALKNPQRDVFRAHYAQNRQGMQSALPGGGAMPVSSMDVAGADRRAIASAGEGADANQINRAFFKELGKESGNRFISVGGKILPPTSSLATFSTPTRGGGTLSTALGGAARQAIGSGAALEEARKGGAPEDRLSHLQGEFDRDMDKLGTAQTKLATSQKVIGIALGATVPTVAGPASGTEGLPANVGVMGRDDFRRSVRHLPAAQQKKMWSQWGRGTGAPYSQFMDPTPDPTAVGQTLAMQSPMNAKRRYGGGNFDPGRGEVSVSPQAVAGQMKDSDADASAYTPNPDATITPIREIMRRAAGNMGNEFLALRDDLTNRVDPKEFMEGARGKIREATYDTLGPAFTAEGQGKTRIAQGYHAVRNLWANAMSTFGGGSNQRLARAMGKISSSAYQATLDQETLGPGDAEMMGIFPRMFSSDKGGGVAGTETTKGVAFTSEAHAGQYLAEKMLRTGDSYKGRLRRGYQTAVAEAFIPLGVEGRKRTRARKDITGIMRDMEGGGKFTSKMQDKFLSAIGQKDFGSAVYGSHKGLNRQGESPLMMAMGAGMTSHGLKKGSPYVAFRAGAAQIGQEHMYTSRFKRFTKRGKGFEFDNLNELPTDQLSRVEGLIGKFQEGTDDDIEVAAKAKDFNDAIKNMKNATTEKDRKEWQDEATAIANQGTTPAIKAKIQAGAIFVPGEGKIDKRPYLQPAGGPKYQGRGGAGGGGGGGVLPPGDPGRPPGDTGTGGGGSRRSGDGGSPRFPRAQLSPQQVEGFMNIGERMATGGFEGATPRVMNKAYTSIDRLVTAEKKMRWDKTGFRSAGDEMMEKNFGRIGELRNMMNAPMHMQRQLAMGAEEEMRKVTGTEAKETAPETMNKISTGIENYTRALQDQGKELSRITKGQTEATKGLRSMTVAMRPLEKLVASVKERDFAKKEVTPEERAAAKFFDKSGGAMSRFIAQGQEAARSPEAMEVQRQERQFKLRSALTQLGYAGKTARARGADLFDEGLDVGSRGRGKAGFTIRNKGLISLAGVGMRAQRAMEDPFALFRMGRIQNFLINPAKQAAQQYQESQAQRGIQLMQTGGADFDDLMGGQLGTMMRRSARSEQLKLGVGEAAYKAYAPAMDFALGKSGPASMVGGVLGPAAGVGLMAGIMGLPALPIAAGVAGYGLSNFANASQSDPFAVARSQQRSPLQNLGGLITDPAASLSRAASGWDSLRGAIGLKMDDDEQRVQRWAGRISGGLDAAVAGQPVASRYLQDAPSPADRVDATAAEGKSWLQRQAQAGLNAIPSIGPFSVGGNVQTPPPAPAVVPPLEFNPEFAKQQELAALAQDRSTTSEQFVGAMDMGGDFSTSEVMGFWQQNILDTQMPDYLGDEGGRTSYGLLNYRTPLPTFDADAPETKGAFAAATLGIDPQQIIGMAEQQAYIQDVSTTGTAFQDILNEELAFLGEDQSVMGQARRESALGLRAGQVQSFEQSGFEPQSASDIALTSWMPSDAGQPTKDLWNRAQGMYGTMGATNPYLDLSQNPLTSGLRSAVERGDQGYIKRMEGAIGYDRSGALTSTLSQFMPGETSGEMATRFAGGAAQLTRTPEMIPQFQAYQAKTGAGKDFANIFGAATTLGADPLQFAQGRAAATQEGMTTQTVMLEAKNVELRLTSASKEGRLVEEISTMQREQRGQQSRLGVNRAFFAAGMGGISGDYAPPGMGGQSFDALMGDQFSGQGITQTLMMQAQMGQTYGPLSGASSQGFFGDIRKGLKAGDRGATNKMNQFQAMQGTMMRQQMYGGTLSTSVNLAMGASALEPVQFNRQMSAGQGNRYALSSMVQKGEITGDMAPTLNSVNMQTGLSNYYENVPDMLIEQARGRDDLGRLEGITDQELRGGTRGLQRRIRDIQVGSIGTSFYYAQQGRDLGAAMNMGGGTLDETGRVQGGDLAAAAGPIFNRLGMDFNAGNGMGQWAIQDRQREMSRQQQDQGLGFGDRNLDLARREFQLRGQQFNERFSFQQHQFAYQTGYQRESMQIGRGRQQQGFRYQEEDQAFNQSAADVSFGFQMEDSDRNIRFSRGRSRIDAMRQRDRQTIQYSMQQGQRDTASDRLTEEKTFQTEQFERTKANFEQTVRFQQEEMEMKRRQFDESRVLELERLGLQLEQHESQKAWIAERRELEDQLTLLQRQSYLANQELAKRAGGAAVAAAIETAKYQDALDALAEEMKRNEAKTALLVETGDLATITMGDNVKKMGELEDVLKRVTINADNLIAKMEEMATVQVGIFRYEAGPAPGSSGGSMIDEGARGGPMEFGRRLSTASMQGLADPPSMVGGGYTGDGGKFDSAGTFNLHKGEYVVPQDGALVLRGEGGGGGGTVHLLRIVELLEEIAAMGPGRVNATIHTDASQVSTENLLDAAYSSV